MKLILQAIKSLLARLSSQIDTLESDTTAAVLSVDNKADAAIATAESIRSVAAKNTSRLDSLAESLLTKNKVCITVGGGVTDANGCISAGYGCVASRPGSAAFGYVTSALSSAQTVIGKFNALDSNGAYVFIVGNGVGNASNSRSNAHTLDWEGNAWYAGTVEGTALILKSSTEGSSKRFKITVDDSGTLTATEVTT